MAAVLQSPLTIAMQRGDEARDAYIAELAAQDAREERARRQMQRRLAVQRQRMAAQEVRARRNAPAEALVEYDLRQTVGCYGTADQYAMLDEALAHQCEPQDC